MKKILIFLVATMLLINMVACGMNTDDGKIPGDGDPTNDGNPNDTNNTDSDNSNNSSNGNGNADGGPSDGNSDGGTTDDAVPPTYQNAHELLAAIWASYGDEEKFPIMGGDYDNVVENAPGAFDLTHADAAVNIDSLLSFPSEEIGKIDSAASIIHGMNTNIFTCGAFHVTDAANVQGCADRVKNHIMTKQFICGSPEKLIVLHIPGDYLIVLYGTADAVTMFAQKTQALITGTSVLVEQALAA